MMVPMAPINGAWLLPSHYPPSQVPLPSQLPPTPTSLPSQSSSPVTIPQTPISPSTSYTLSPSPSSSSAPSPSSSTSSNRRHPAKKRCRAAIDDPVRYGHCNYRGHSKELKKHYGTTHSEYAKKIGLPVDPIACPACGTELRAGRNDFLKRHQTPPKGKETSACENKLAALKRQKARR